MDLILKMLTNLRHWQARRHPDKHNRNQFKSAYQDLEKRGY